MLIELYNANKCGQWKRQTLEWSDYTRLSRERGLERKAKKYPTKIDICWTWLSTWCDHFIIKLTCLGKTEQFLKIGCTL